MVYLAAAAAIGGAISSYQSNKKAKKVRQRREDDARLALKHRESDIDLGINEAEQSLYKAMGASEKGINEARAETRRQGGEEKLRVRDRGDQVQAEVQGNLQSRGFGASNIATQARGSIQGETARGIGGVDEDVTAQYAELGIRRELANAQIITQISDLQVARTGARIGAARDRYNLAVGIDLPEYQGSVNNFGGLVSGIQTLAGSFGGGGSGLADGTYGQGQGVYTPSANPNRPPLNGPGSYGQGLGVLA